MNHTLVCLFATAGFDKSAQGLLGAAERLAAATEGRVTALLLGPGAGRLAQDIAPLAATVLVAEGGAWSDPQPEACLDAITRVCREIAPRAVLFSSDTWSQEMAPRLAHRLGGTAVGDAIALEVRDGVICATRQVYGGKAQAVIALRRSPGVAWLRARSFAPATPGAPGEIRDLGFEPGAVAHIRVVERLADATGQVRLEDARVIVAGGRGIGGAEPFQQELARLAEVLGGQIAATRAACDAGWVPALLQVGTTGKKVAPELYLAVALSGASQHTAGISDARNIAAINTDPEAPIFKHCSFGLVGDYRQVVPLLRERLAALCK